jgi:DNA-binding protein HU-beta
MNKTQLVDALAERLGDRRTAATAVDGLLQTIVDAVRSGDSVSLTGFGVFEGRARAARVARNPRTGEPVDVPATTVPAFRPGAGFRTAVGGGGAPAPRSAPRSSQTRSASAPAASAVAGPGKQRKAKSDAAVAEKPGKAGKAGKAGKGAKAEKSKPAPKSKADKPKKAKPK